jgi:hypothetical protein
MLSTIFRRDVRQHQAGAEQSRGFLQFFLAAPGGPDVREHDVYRKRGRVLSEDLQVPVRGEPFGLPRLRHQVERYKPPRCGGVQRLRESRDEKVR